MLLDGHTTMRSDTIFRQCVEMQARCSTREINSRFVTCVECNMPWRSYTCQLRFRRKMIPDFRTIQLIAIAFIAGANTWNSKLFTVPTVLGHPTVYASHISYTTEMFHKSAHSLRARGSAFFCCSRREEYMEPLFLSHHTRHGEPSESSVPP